VNFGAALVCRAWCAEFGRDLYNIVACVSRVVRNIIYWRANTTGRKLILSLNYYLAFTLHTFSLHEKAPFPPPSALGLYSLEIILRLLSGGSIYYIKW
jgi:hypothetical protein